jgi:hypothetical protein
VNPVLRSCVLILLTAAYLQAEEYMIPAAANASGAQGTNWKTDVVLLNPGTTPVCADLYFLEADKDNLGAPAHPLDILGGRQEVLSDVVGAFFGAPGKAGAVRIVTDGPLVITSRTFNDLGEAGTYGQGVPALTSDSALHAGASRTLLPLLSTELFRTNLGMVNGSASAARMEARFYEGDPASPLGMLAWDLRPYEYLQQNNVLGLLGVQSCEDAYAVLTVTTAGATVYPWASIVDNRTGDPVFTPAAETAMLTVAPEREWVRAMGWAGDDLAHIVAATEGGGMWVAGETAGTGAGTGDAWLFKLDAYGRVLSMGILEGPGQDKIFGLQALSGGGAVVCGGSTPNPGSSHWDAWAAVVDANGGTLWSKTYSQTASGWLYGILALHDGTFRACGQVVPEDGSPDKAWVLSLDASGNILWQKWLAGPLEEWLYSLAPAEAGGCVAAGGYRATGTSGWDGWLVRMDTSGNVLWEKAIGGSGADAVYGIVSLPGGGYALAGQTDSWEAVDADLWMCRVDAEGILVWSRTLGSRDWDVGYAAAASDDGRILAAGQTGTNTGGYGNAWVSEWDMDGALLSQASFGSVHPERFYGAAARPDAGWVAAGRTESKGAGGKDLLLVALPDGLAPAEPCPFASAPDWGAKDAPAETRSISSLRGGSQASPAPFLPFLSPASGPADEILCGAVHEGPFRYRVPAVARTAGAHGTQWRTDLCFRCSAAGVVDAGSAVRLTFFPSDMGTGPPLSATVDGEPGALVRIPDVLGTLFEREQTSGSLLAEADDPLEVWTVTYTQDAQGGTYGQSIPGFVEGAAIGAGGAGFAAGLVQNAAYRTNLGFSEIAGETTDLIIRVFDTSGLILLTAGYQLPATGWLQVGLIDLGISSLDAGRAEVEVIGGGAVLAYASVVDNRTGDPVFVPALRAIDQ